jgi:hypothetical protein
MGKRRRRRTRSDDGGSHDEDAPGFPVFEHSTWSTAGELERWSAFGRGLAYSRGRKRRLGLSFSVVVLVVIGFGALATLIAVVQALQS